MKVIAEISLYPLSREYETPILDFIRRIRGHAGIAVTVGETSTLIHGEYDAVLRILTSECRESLDTPHRAVFVMKLLNVE